MGTRRAVTKNQIRALAQYKDLSDDEFDKLWLKKVTGVEVNREFEERIANKINEFSEDYDLEDLKANDKLVLRALAQAYISLEDLENYQFNLRVQGIADVDIIQLEKLNNVMSGLRRDISNMQNDLKITRKVRKGDQEESVKAEVIRIKEAASEFYKQRMFYVFCPKCKMLLFTGWFLYPDNYSNKIKLRCFRTLDNGHVCGNEFEITSKTLMERRGVNIDELPETMK